MKRKVGMLIYTVLVGLITTWLYESGLSQILFGLSLIFRWLEMSGLLSYLAAFISALVGGVLGAVLVVVVLLRTGVLKDGAEKHPKVEAAVEPEALPRRPVETAAMSAAEVEPGS